MPGGSGTAQVTVAGLPELGRKLTRLEREALPRATYRAVNKTATTVRAEAARDIAHRMGSRVSGVRRHSKIYRASLRHLQARIIFDGKALNLIEFKARQAKAGVSAAAWNERKIWPQSFIARIHGHRLVMIRRKKAGGGRVGRLPIRAMLGPSVPSTAAEEELVHAREDLVRRTLRERIESQLEYEVGKLKEKGR